MNFSDNFSNLVAIIPEIIETLEKLTDCVKSDISKALESLIDVLKSSDENTPKTSRKQSFTTVNFKPLAEPIMVITFFIQFIRTLMKTDGTSSIIEW